MSDQCSGHGMWLSTLKDYLAKGRYTASTVCQYVSVAHGFLRYLDEQHLEIRTAQPANVEQYLRHAWRRYRRRHGHSRDYKDWRYSYTRCIHMLLRVVQGKWPPVPPAVTSLERFSRKVCEEYATWMTEMRGLASDTVSDHTAEAHRFLHWLGERAIEGLTTVTVADLDAYMKHRAGSLCRRSLKSLRSMLRSFLRWLHTAGHTAHDLSNTVIGPSLYAFEGIPSALRSQDVDRILSVARQDRTPKGLRDYAVLMLLARYGLRAGEITGLRLDDMDWRKDAIRIRHTKTEATSYLPLLPEVGSAILCYLQRSRPKTSFRELFIYSRAPYRPFANGSSLYALIRKRIDCAEVLAEGKRGPHAFRHALAVSMIRASVPLKEIGDVLGHRASNSTLAYLKLATEDLRGIALEIPEEVKP